MTRNNSYSIYFCLIFLLFHGVESFTPTGRLGHSSVLIGDKLFFFGGVQDNSTTSDDSFFLDLTQPFNVAVPPWTGIPSIPFESAFAGVASDNKDNPSIYIIGGLMNDVNTHQDSFKSLVYKYDVKASTWSVPTTSGTAPGRRLEMKAVSDNTGKLYVFGGGASSLIGAAQKTLFNDMFILNTVTPVDLAWSTSATINTIKGRTSYSATLLSNGNIVYIGGLEFADNKFQTQDISQIILFNTNSLTWSTKMAKFTNQVDNRQRHTAVLGPKGQIIVYGGSKVLNDKRNAQAIPTLAVLNTEVDPFEWTAPSVSSNTGKFPALAGHTADLVGSYMIVAFGNITQQNDEPLPVKSTNVYVMDIRNYTWIGIFDKSLADAGNGDLVKIIIASVCGVVGSVIIMVGGYFGYKRYKKKKELGSGFPGANPPVMTFDQFGRPLTGSTQGYGNFPGTPDRFSTSDRYTDSRYSNYSNAPLPGTPDRFNAPLPGTPDVLYSNNPGLERLTASYTPQNQNVAYSPQSQNSTIYTNTTYSPQPVTATYPSVISNNMDSSSQVQPGAERLNSPQPGAIGYNTNQPGAIGYNTNQPGAVGYNTTQSSNYNNNQPGAAYDSYQ